MHNENQHLLMTIPRAKQFLEDATYYGPFLSRDTSLYEKKDKWYQVTVPCLACLGLKEYDMTSPIVEIIEVDPNQNY